MVKYLIRHQNKLRFILLIYVGILLIESIVFSPLLMDVYIRTGHFHSAGLVLLSLITLMCGFYGFLKLNRYCCIFFITFYTIKNITGATHDFLMMHQNYQLFSPIAWRHYLIDVYSSLILSILILILGTLLLYFDFLKERSVKK